MSGLAKRVTIKDVAKAANVAIGTVSRFLNNNGYVSNEATARIKTAIEDLDFIPSSAARSMINKKSSIIGITVPEINNPFLADLVVRLEATLSKMNYSIMLCNNKYSSLKVANFIDDLIMRNAEGLILVATDIDDEVLEKKMKNFLRPIFIGHKRAGFDSICIGDYDSSYQLTKHLISLDHKRIGFIGYNENARQTMIRVEGYCAALEDAGLHVLKELMLQSCAGHSDGYLLAKQLLSMKDRPSAMIAINDFYAVHAYAAIADAGIRVGDDISIAGFDDILMAKFISPPLTTVRCDCQELVDRSIDLLLDMIEGEHEASPTELMLSSHLVLRESTKIRSI